MIYFRTILFIFVVFLALSVPWWAAFFLGFLSIIIFGFPEMIFIGFVLDMVYSSFDHFFTRFIFTFSFFVLYLVSSNLRKYIRILG